MCSVKNTCDLNWIKQESQPTRVPSDRKRLSLGDLFCGCGGLSLGVAEAARTFGRNLDIRFAIDTSEVALKVYQQNFRVGDDVAVCADIRKILPGRFGDSPSKTEQQLIDRVRELDVLVAGPPCQGHSDLNNSSRRSDKRNQLYLKVARFAELVRTKVIIIENVPAVIHDHKGVVEQSKKNLSKIGYSIKEGIVNFLNFGLPQNRKRHIIFASLDNKFDLPEDLFKKTQNGAPISSVIEDIQDECSYRKGIFFVSSNMSRENVRRVQYLFENDIYDLPDVLRPKCHQNGAHSYKSMYGRLRWDKPAQTITAGFGSMGQGRFVHPTRCRVLTPHEVARLQGFPDFFSFSSVCSRSLLHEMLGNAVPPQLSARIVAKLIDENIL